MRRGFWVLVIALALAGCSKADTSTLPNGTVPKTAKIPKDYDPSRETATATELRDRLDAAGLPCDGKPKMTNRYEDNFGNVLSLTCTVNDHVVSIGVFRNPKEADAGLGKLTKLNCLFTKDPTFYARDDTWSVVVGSSDDGTTTQAATAPIAEALGRPVEKSDCP